MDSLTDFAVADDTIRLDQAVSSKLTTLGSLNAGLFRSSANGAAGDSNDYILYNASTGSLAYDADGSGSARPSNLPPSPPGQLSPLRILWWWLKCAGVHPLPNLSMAESDEVCIVKP